MLLASIHKLSHAGDIIPSSISILLHLDTVLPWQAVWLVGVPFVIDPGISIYPVKIVSDVKSFPPVQESTEHSTKVTAAPKSNTVVPSSFPSKSVCLYAVAAALY